MVNLGNDSEWPHAAAYHLDNVLIGQQPAWNVIGCPLRPGNRSRKAEGQHNESQPTSCATKKAPSNRHCNSALGRALQCRVFRFNTSACIVPHSRCQSCPVYSSLLERSFLLATRRVAD